MPFKMIHLILVALIIHISGCSDNTPDISDPNAEEKLFINGAIYVDGSIETALLIDNGIIKYVGEEAEAKNRASREVEIIDLGGQFMMPGIHDIHLHPLEAASDNFQFTLDTPVEDAEDYVVEIEAAISQHLQADWILGWGYDLEILLDTERLPKEILDDISLDKPIAIMEVTSHSIWCNSKALELANYSDDSENPVGGILMRDVDGTLNGILMDNAGNLIIDLALPVTDQSKENDYHGLKDFALPELAKHGITSICDARTYWKREHHKTWQRLADEEALTVRVNLGLWAYPNDNDETQLETLKQLYAFDENSLLKINQIKLYSDGIIHNTTSAMHEDFKVDYFGELTNNGINYFTQERLARYMSELEPVGFDFHIHAIGNRSIHESLNAIEQSGHTAGRHRLTHVEYVDEVDYQRFANLNVTADAQVAGDFTNPEHWHDFDHLINMSLTENVVPIKSLLANGARVALSSDWDVSSLNPFIGMQNAVTRSPQNISIEQAIAAYTIHPAYVMRQEDQVGSIEVDKEADLIVLDKNLLEIPANEINTVQVLKTYLKGKLIYEQ